MNTKTTTTVTVRDDDSPFHRGELELQTRNGIRESVGSFARKAIRSYLPDQHREFFAQLPFVVLGSVDEQGWPWSSILAGRPGFMRTPDPTRLELSARTLPGDPLTSSLVTGKRLGLLGIDPTTRRRNRVNVHVVASSAGRISLDVDQSFGNCPQYIQRRSIDFIRDADVASPEYRVEKLESLDESARRLIASADTFFVASHVDVQHRPDREGVDVSHRGGQPGFVKVDGDTLTIPDYPGNNLFNTLGNFLLNPRAGLLFVDFTRGDLLQLSGTVDILDEEDADIRAFKGADRGWRFHVRQGQRVLDSLPFRSTFMDYSPNTLLTGNWGQTEAIQAAEQLRNSWRPFRITRVVDESTVIRSFHLQADDQRGLLPFKAGQHLQIRLTVAGSDKSLIRSYTLSSAPGDDHYRISVKREAPGVVSAHLHDHLRPGDRVEIKGPAGDFWIDPTETRPAVLLAAGVGITPMIAMARHLTDHAVLSRHARPLTILHACRLSEQRAFADEFLRLQQHSEGRLNYYRIVSEGRHDDLQEQAHDRQGRIDAAMLRSILPLDDYDFLLCGPPGFMQSLYEALRLLGVADDRIQAETFGPSSLQRSLPAAPLSTTSLGANRTGSQSAAELEEADEALVHFTASGFEQRWSHGDPTLLEVAEAHGLTPEFSCRKGSCGSCATRLLSGQVNYRQSPTAATRADEVLICCAVPARGSEAIRLEL